jgi:hypothetical protein
VVPVTLNVNLKYATLKPVLSASPSSIHQTIPRGNQTFVQVNFANTGQSPTGSLQTFIPSSHPFLSLISPAIIPSLAPGEVASAVLKLELPVNASFGALTGSISVSNSIVGRSVSFRFEIVSTLFKAL